MGRSLIVFIAFFFLTGCGSGKYRASKVIFDDTYRIADTDNMEFVFSDDSTLVVRQKGIYEFKENEPGELVVRICLDDISRELPEDYNFTEYLLRRAEDHIVLTYTTEEFNLDANPMMLFLLDGEDGLITGEYFEGTYQIGADGDSYQYIFKEDGSITMQVTEHYYADKKKMILSDHAGSTQYQYEASEDAVILKNTKGETVLTLQKEAGP